MLLYYSMNRAYTIAGVVLTLNEERDLPHALQSLSWCDELVVVDSGSTDRTREVAIKLGASFFQHIQTPPFLITDQRNWALANCHLTSDWVLFLDADEEITTQLKSSILSHIALDRFTSFYLCPKYMFMGRWLYYVQSFPNWHPRLVRRGKQEFTGGVWETFKYPSDVGKISDPYLHHGFSKGLDDWISRHQRYALWDAKRITTPTTSSQPERKSILRKLSDQFWPIRPLTGFIYKYIFCRGFLDGWQGLLYCCLLFSYDLFVVVYVLQFRNQRKNRDT